jgi:hypothetical protein
LQDATGDKDYTLTNISEAPWYDEQEEASHRFLGVHALSVEGLMDSTRTASIAEGVTDGGVVGQVRHAVRQTRYRALLSAIGEDALESGLAWLKAALDPDFCGTHGNSCGAVDSCFFTACPPQKKNVVTKTIQWATPPVINLATNPSFETAAGAPSVLATNLATNPSFETPGTVQVLATNQVPNPSFETLSGAAVTVRTNLFTSPVSTGPWPNVRGTQTPLADGVQFDITSEVGQGDWVVINNMRVANAVGQPFITSIEVEVPVGYPAISVFWQWESGPMLNGAPVTIAPGEKKRVGTPAGFVPTVATDSRGVLRVGSFNVPVGARFIVRKMLAEYASVERPYFDGSTLNAGDWTYAWTGATDASTSIQMGLPVAGYTGANAHVVTSQEWSSNRARSLRVISLGGSNARATMSLIGLKPNTAYTARAVIRLTVAQIAANERARAIMVGTDVAGYLSPQAPNAPGVYPLSVAFMTGASGTANVDLYNSGERAGDEVWFDDLMVVEGNYTDPYFDGSTLAVRRNLFPYPRANSLTGWQMSGAFNGGTWLSTPSGIQFDTVNPQGSAITHPDWLPATPGRSYVGSFEVTVPSGFPAITVYTSLQAQTAGGSSGQATVIQPGQTVRVLSDVAVNAAGNTALRPVLWASTNGIPAGGRLVVRNGLFEQTDQHLPYFDGATPFSPYAAAWEGAVDASPSYLYQPEFTYAWTGTPDASTSTKSGMGMAGIPASTPAMQSADDPAEGDYVVRFTLTNGDNQPLNLTANPPQGGTYTIIGKVRPRTRDQSFEPTIGGVRGPSFTAPKDVWTDFRYTAVSGSGFDGTGLFIVNGASGHTAGDLVDVDAVMLVAGAYVGPYFDGDSPDGVFTYAWTGAANASTSTLSAVDVADATLPIAGQVARWQDTESPVSGTKIARFQTLVSSALYFPFAAYGHTTGDTFTIVGKVRPKNRDTTFAVSIRGTKSPTFVAPAGVWTEFRAEIIAGGAAANTTGLYTVAGATQPGDIIDIDTVLMTLGDYLNQYFDGDTPDNPEDPVAAELPVGTRLERYVWTGTPHASTSTKEDGQVVSAPDPDEWARITDNLQRTMHDVTCISGPLIEQKFHRDEMWGYIVEFTLAAGTPWLFGKTRPILVPPSLPVVVQDVPFNLVPYPSAELATGTVVVTKNFATNPSAETNVAGWTAASDGVKILMPQIAVSQSNELAAAGGFSAKALFTANTTNSAGWFRLGQAVPLTGITPTTRYSVNVWASANVQSGTAVLGNIEFIVFWLNASNAVLGSDIFGTLPASGGAVSKKSMLPPAGTTQVVVEARINVTSWSSGALIRLYADALALTVP